MRRCLPATIFAVTVLAAAPAAAATLCVNPGGTGGCFASVQAAVTAAANRDVVQLFAGTYVEDVVVGPRRTLTIQGVGSLTTILEGTGSGDVLSVGERSRVLLSGLGLHGGARGLVVGEGASVEVFGVWFTDSIGSAIMTGPRSRLAMQHVLVSGSGESAVDTGAVLVAGRARIVSSTIRDNLQGGIFAGHQARLDLQNCEVTGNGQNGIRLQRGVIRDSSVSGNGGTGIHVGIVQFGAPRGSLRLTNSTVHGNEDGITVLPFFNTVLDHVTVSGNTGSGLGRAGIATKATLRLSIVADNGLADCSSATLRLQGANLIEDPSGCAISGTPQLTGDPLLGVLTDDGFHPPWQALLPGSPALDVVTGSGCRLRDQRNVERTSPCDLGATESP